jgi:hypothetical protein
MKHKNTGLTGYDFLLWGRLAGSGGMVPRRRALWAVVFILSLDDTLRWRDTFVRFMAHTLHASLYSKPRIFYS